MQDNLTIQDLTNKDAKQLVHIFKDLIINLAEESMMIYNAAVQADVVDELYQDLEEEKYWVKKVWMILNLPSTRFKKSKLNNYQHPNLKKKVLKYRLFSFIIYLQRGRKQNEEISSDVISLLRINCLWKY